MTSLSALTLYDRQRLMPHHLQGHFNAADVIDVSTEWMYPPYYLSFLNTAYVNFMSTLVSQEKLCCTMNRVLDSGLCSS